MADAPPAPPADHRFMTELAHVEVDFNGQRHRLGWPPGQTLVDTLLDAGLNVPHSCREGHCGSCVATLVQGEVDMVACGILEPADVHAGLILACQARPLSTELRVEF
jgi:ferredoxin